VKGPKAARQTIYEIWWANFQVSYMAQAPLILNKGKMQLKSLMNGGFQELKICPNSVDDIKNIEKIWETQSGS
jgi:hypothetical protein